MNMWNSGEKPVGSWDMEEMQNQDPGTSNTDFWQIIFGSASNWGMK